MALGLIDKWPKVIGELGLDNVKSMVEKTTLENGKFVTRSLLRTEGKPHGLLVNLINGGVDDSLLKCAPADATFALAGKLDLGKLYDQIKASSIEVGGESMKQQIDQAEAAAANVQIVPRDAPAPLGDQWLIYNAASTGGWFFLGTTMVGTVKDEKQVNHTLDVLMAMMVQNSGSQATFHSAKWMG